MNEIANAISYGERETKSYRYFRRNRSPDDRLSDAATILESDDRIAILINFDNLSRAKTAKLRESVLPVQRFCLCCFFYFLVSIFVVLTLSSLVALLMQSEFLKCDGFLPKNPTIWWKRARRNRRPRVSLQRITTPGQYGNIKFSKEIQVYTCIFQKLNLVAYFLMQLSTRTN